MTDNKVLYYWVASCEDGAFQDQSDKAFNTEEECYNDMRNSALEKMKWNTEYADDFCDVEDGDYIKYDVQFFKDKIIHYSYSGKYIYEIRKQSNVMPYKDEYCTIVRSIEQLDFQDAIEMARLTKTLTWQQGFGFKVRVGHFLLNFYNQNGKPKVNLTEISVYNADFEGGELIAKGTQEFLFGFLN